jgi:AraC-like DNA-binding protein
MPDKCTARRYSFRKIATDDFPLIVEVCEEPNHTLHSHDFIEMIIVQSGKGVHLTKNTRHPVSMGDVIVIPKGARHGYDCVENLKIVNVIFDNALLQNALSDLMQLPGYHTLFSAARSPRRERQPVKYEISALAPDEISHLEKIALRIKAELAKKNPGYKALCAALLTETVVFMSRKEFKQDTFVEKSGIDRVFAFIEQNHSKKIKLETLVKINGYSMRTFYRAFVKASGQSPFEYLINVRLLHAKQFLLNPSMNISEIAERTGFTDSAYFSRQFKKFFGISPKTYRERAGKK